MPGGSETQSPVPPPIPGAGSSSSRRTTTHPKVPASCGHRTDHRRHPTGPAVGVASPPGVPPRLGHRRRAASARLDGFRTCVLGEGVRLLPFLRQHLRSRRGPSCGLCSTRTHPAVLVHQRARCGRGRPAPARARNRRRHLCPAAALGGLALARGRCRHTLHVGPLPAGERKPRAPRHALPLRRGPGAADARVAEATRVVAALAVGCSSARRRLSA